MKKSNVVVNAMQSSVVGMLLGGIMAVVVCFGAIPWLSYSCVGGDGGVLALTEMIKRNAFMIAAITVVGPIAAISLYVFHRITGCRPG